MASLPAWFRCAQSIRRWHDENWSKSHLTNAIRFCCMISVVLLSVVAQPHQSYFELTPIRIIWFIAASLSSAFNAYWVMIHDFGVLLLNGEASSKMHLNASLSTKICSTGESRRRKYPLLRDSITYSVWFYYFVIFEDWILQFGWMLTISLAEFSNIDAELAVSLLAPLEIFRRFLWNCIQLDHEQATRNQRHGVGLVSWKLMIAP